MENTLLNIKIRTIGPADSADMQALITRVVSDMGIMDSEYLGSGADELDDLYQLYQAPRSRYYIVSDIQTQKILGGGGLAPLSGVNDDGIGEIQKMYFAPELRGRGIGSQLIAKLLEDAKDFSFTSLYLETRPDMLGAIKLYERSGFTRIPNRMGSTGHECCTIFMQRLL